MRIRLRRLVTLLLVLLLPSRALAQRTARSFDQLQLLIEAGDNITVRDVNGAETTGRVDTLSAHALAIVSQGTRREWVDTDVTRISQRRQDSLANGALWGLAGGAGTIEILAAGFCAEGECTAGAIVAAAAVYSGLGVAAGVGIDALITRRHVVYEKVSRPVALSVAPVVSGSKWAVAVSVRY